MGTMDEEDFTKRKIEKMGYKIFQTARRRINPIFHKKDTLQ